MGGGEPSGSRLFMSKFVMSSSRMTDRDVGMNGGTKMGTKL